MHDIYQREYGLKDIFSKSWSLFRDNFWNIALVTCFIYFPLSVVINFFSDVITSRLPNTNNMFDEGVRFNAIYYLAGVYNFVFGTIGVMAITFLVKFRLDGQPVEIKGFLKKVIVKWLSALITLLMTISFIMIIGVMFMSLIGGVRQLTNNPLIFNLFLYPIAAVFVLICFIYCRVVLYVIPLCDKFGLEALRHSLALIKGRWLRSGAYILVFCSIYPIFFLVLFCITFPLIAKVGNAGGFFSLGADILINICNSFIIVLSAVFFINFSAINPRNITPRE